MEHGYLGLPRIVVKIAENQDRSSQDLNQNNLINWLGTSISVGIPELRSSILKCLENKEENYLQSYKGMQLSCGNSTSHVAFF